MVWSFSTSDPTGPNGEGAQQHAVNSRGTRSLNLLGGLIGGPANPNPEDSFLDIVVSNVSFLKALNVAS